MRTAQQILDDHAAWQAGNGGSRLVWSNLDEDELANLSGANLSGANLRWANLRWAKAIVALPVADPRGYRPVAVWYDDGWRVCAGCRSFLTIDEAREHWGPDYEGDRETGDSYVSGIDWLLERQAALLERWEVAA